MPLARAPDLMWVPNLMGLVAIIKRGRGDREAVGRQVHLYPHAAESLCEHPERPYTLTENSSWLWALVGTKESESATTLISELNTPKL